MSYSVKISSEFSKEAKQIAKKHKGIKEAITNLIAELEINPLLGVSLGQNLYKIRLAISGTNKGKSGGARVITYVIISNKVVILTEIYLKSEQDSIDSNSIIDRIRDAGLI